jgi:hypothetical protein
MILNLHKHFSFHQQKDIYQVDYVFQKDSKESDIPQQRDVCLIVTFSKNNGDKITDTTNKATSILFQSNESIQQLIEAKILSYN